LGGNFQARNNWAKGDKIITSNVVKQRKRGLEEGGEIPEKMAQKTAELFVIK